MPQPPNVLIPHSVPESMRAELATEIKSRVPTAEIHTAGSEAETGDLIEDAEVVLTYSLSNDLIDRATNLEWVQALSAGVDAFDQDHLRENDVRLTNASGVHAEPIAEQVLGYLLLFERNLLRAIHRQREHAWGEFEGGEIRGKTLGVVGVGAIGSRIAEVGASHGMTVIGTKRTPETAPDVLDEVYPPEGLSKILPRVDYLVVSCPLTKQTRGLLGEAELDAMSSSSVLINVGRGPIVDQDALDAALEAADLAGAALDVFEEEPLPEDSPLWDRSNVVVTPHMAGKSPYLNERKAELFAKNYRAFVDDEGLTNRIV